MDNEVEDDESSPFSLYLSIATALAVVASVALSISGGELTPLTFICYCFASVFLFTVCIAVLLSGMRLYGILIPRENDDEDTLHVSDVIVFFALSFVGVIAGFVALEFLFSIAGIQREISVTEIIMDILKQL